MSENSVITENAYEAPVQNAYDGSESAFEASDSQQSLEQALDDKAETEQIQEKIEDLEASQESETAEVEEPKTETDEFSSKFAALSRREKALRERESGFDAKLAALEEKFAAMQDPQEPEITTEPEISLEQKLKRDPLTALAEMGLSYDKLTQLALNDGKLTTEMQMNLMRDEMDQKYSSELDSLRNDLLDRDKRAEEEKYNETVTNFKSELTNFVNDDDSYELIRANDAVDVVYDVIEQHYQDTGRIMAKDEAANQVEQYLEEEVEKLFKINKLRTKFGIKDEAQETKPTEPTQVQKVPTLSNAHSAKASNTSRPQSRDNSVISASSLLRWND